MSRDTENKENCSVHLIWKRVVGFRKFQLPGNCNLHRISHTLIVSVVYPQPSRSQFTEFIPLLLKMWTMSATPGSSLALRNLRSHPDLLNQNLHFNQIPRVSVRTCISWLLTPYDTLPCSQLQSPGLLSTLHIFHARSLLRASASAVSFACNALLLDIHMAN